MRLALVILCTLCGCEPPLDEQGRQMAVAADGVSTGLEAGFKAGWVVSPAADADQEAISITRDIINDVFGLCAQADQLPHGLNIRFNGNCGVPLTNLRFEGGLSVEVSDGTLAIVFADLHLPSIVLDGSADFTRLPDGDFAWQLHQLSAEVADHRFVLDGGGSARYSDDRTSVRFDGAGSFTSDEITVSYVADGIERRLLLGCWPERGTLIIHLTVLGVTREMKFRYTGDQTVHLDDKGGRTLDHDLPDRDCRSLSLW